MVVYPDADLGFSSLAGVLWILQEGAVGIVELPEAARIGALESTIPLGFLLDGLDMSYRAGEGDGPGYSRLRSVLLQRNKDRL
ncbi:MAG TPA: hypothetical protein DD435_08795 [Cyanobacteria bacterium UBA8530]|nr:hypothetical protein [Cyanobacteria bacterium UBA8530]